MKREDSKPAPATTAAPQLLRKKSGKFASASYLHLVDAAKTKQLWRMTAPKPAASETDIDTYVLQPPQIQEVQPERPLFDRIVSDNVLLQPRSASHDVLTYMVKQWPHNSDAILAHPNARALLHEDVGCIAPKQPSVGKGGVKTVRGRIPIGELLKEKHYEGRIERKTRTGLLIDINSTVLGLLRWKWLKGVPRSLQKPGGFLGNLLVTKADPEEGRVNLKIETVGFYHDTVEETEYNDIESWMLSWAGIPGAPAVARIPGEVPPPAKPARRLRPPIEGRLRRSGKMGPRR